MYPCDPTGKKTKWWQHMTNLKKGTTATGKAGPFVGHGKPVTSADVQNATDYISAMQPSSLVAYSRGGVVAQKSGNLPSDMIYLSPAWGRGYGVKPEEVSGSGKIFHGAGDWTVPLKHSAMAAQQSGMKLYTHPSQNHFNILTSWRDASSPPVGEYTEITPEIIDLALKPSDEGGLESWGEEKITREDSRVQLQQQWVQKHVYGEVIQETLVRQLIKSILISEAKKDVKCPQKNGKRDYKCEYQKYGGASKKGKKDRAARNQARKVAKREGRVKKGDGKEIDHKKPLSKGGSHAKSNQRVISRSTNRKKGNK